MIIKINKNKNKKKIEYIRYTRSETDCLLWLCITEKLDINNLIDLPIEWLPEFKRLFKNLRIK